MRDDVDVTDSDIQALIDRACTAATYAYVPYSHYPVGAALRATDGTVYGGCNVENASFSPTICAERTALVKAVSEGQRQFDAIAVVTRDGGTPCGVCRQVLAEFAPDLRVIVADLDGRVHLDTSLRDLLPYSFDAGSLKAGL